MNATSSTPVRPGSPQQPSPTAHARPTPSGYATTKPYRSAASFQPYASSAWPALPKPPCSMTTSGTGAVRDSEAGR